MAPIRIRFLPLAAIAYALCAFVFSLLAGAPLWAPGQRAFLALNLLVAVAVGVAGGYLRRPGGTDGWGGLRLPRRPAPPERSARRGAARRPARRPRA